MMKAFAPAKLNLSLRVFPPRQDGLHPVDSIVQTVLGETLEAEPADGPLDTLEIVDQRVGQRESIDAGPSNLVLRAVAALRNAGAEVPPMRFVLHKEVPSAAGLGGGSGDAAAALVLAAAHASSDVPDLEAVGATVGSDVPVLLRGGTVRVQGTGEVLDDLLPVTDYGLLVWVPGFGLSTGAVYRRFDEMGFPRGPAVEEVPVGLEPHVPLVNDLTPAAESLDPRVAGHLDALSVLFERPALLSGSGSSMFCFFDDPEAAAEAARCVSWQLQRLDPEARLLRFVRPHARGAALETVD